jgi:hypothetical protein
VSRHRQDDDWPARDRIFDEDQTGALLFRLTAVRRFVESVKQPKSGLACFWKILRIGGGSIRQEKSPSGLRLGQFATNFAGYG